MNEWILFTIGIFIGGMLGVMIMAFLSVNRYNDMNSEIQDLRTQRELLKVELVKKQSKPRPRKFRVRKKKNGRN
jgi:uncharacterized membrane-anchored protein YhcB (DUF1043 family)|tara:strand:+ start:186 stop:407 length:222 start_codon:yes stop_codon:yes gene_type:complete